MTRRRVFAIAATVLGLIVVVYGIAGVRLIVVAKHLQAETKTISSLVSQEKPDGMVLKSELVKLSSNVDTAKSQINQGIWRPFIWVSGQSNRFVEIRSAVDDASSILKIAPALLGTDTPRKYLLVFQNPAEARGTGGIIGGYASIEVKTGRIKILKVGSNVDLHSLERMPIFISKEFIDLYRNDPAIWQNSNMSPHFPYGARIYLALWRAQFKENLDGVITIDPIALSSVLKVIGPITMPDGRVITSANVVEDTLSLAYQRFEKDNMARKNYLAELAKIVLQHLSQSAFSKTDLAKEMITPIKEHRILFYSSNLAEEKVLEKTIIGGALDDQPNNEYRVVVENTSGNKMDYYLDRKVAITAVGCGPEKITSISVTMTNTVGRYTKLPSYVKGRLDLHAPDGVKNSHGILVLIYGPTDGSLLSRNSALGDQSIFSVKTERKRPVLLTFLDLKPGKPQTINAQFQGGKGPITFVKQPLVRPMVSTISDKCSS